MASVLGKRARSYGKSKQYVLTATLAPLSASAHLCWQSHHSFRHAPNGGLEPNTMPMMRMSTRKGTSGKSNNMINLLIRQGRLCRSQRNSLRFISIPAASKHCTSKESYHHEVSTMRTILSVQLKVSKPRLTVLFTRLISICRGYI